MRRKVTLVAALSVTAMSLLLNPGFALAVAACPASVANGLAVSMPGPGPEFEVSNLLIEPTEVQAFDSN